MAVLIQWAKDDGPVQLHEVWREPICETLELIEMMMADPEGVVGFNLAFDHFHLCKLYTTLVQFKDHNALPQNHIDEIAVLEEKGRFGECIKPVKAMDLMLHARKGPYQSVMARDAIRVKRVPTALAELLAEELERRIPLPDIYFAKRKKKNLPQWQIRDVTDADGNIVPDLKDIILKFQPSSALKALYEDAFGIEENVLDRFASIECDARPNELGFAPFAMALGKPGSWNMTWPQIIEVHISHWAYREKAREYARKDVEITRDLWKFFDCPEPGDDDSVLACMVGAVRWKGFAIDREGIEKLRVDAVKRQINIPKSPGLVRAWITEHLDDTELLALKDPKTGKASTKKVLLEDISEWQNEDGTPHKAALRAKDVLDARKAAKEVELYDKLLRANRFHASFIVIGTRSSRMAGTDQFNAQGIKHTTEVRSKFPLADGDFILCGGDFDAFEVSIADAAYNDPALRADLESGKKVHGLFGMSLFPDFDYDQILASKGAENDMYDKGKRGVFAILYGGNENTLKDRIGIPIEHAEVAFKHFTTKYRGVGLARQRTDNMFCTMRQPKGIGTAVEWHDPEEYIESLTGFKRYFTLENKVAKVLFDLANKIPATWKKIPVHVTRRAERGRQTGAGAIMSALYAAAFQIQAANMRAAANHEIQSTGATITKAVQRAIWDLQPAGIWNWLVQPMNIHDEIMTPCLPSIAEKVEETVKKKVEEYREIVPLIGITWERDMRSWAEK